MMGLLSFTNSDGVNEKKEFHHAALFGMTRWTNLFFPMSQLFWGDAVGGPLKDIWGRYVRDVEVSTLHDRPSLRFSHTALLENYQGPLAAAMRRKLSPCGGKEYQPQRYKSEIGRLSWSSNVFEVFATSTSFAALSPESRAP